MAKRVAFLRLLLCGCDLALLDEPFVGLDPEASFHVKEMLPELADGGSAGSFSRHVLEVGEELCNKVAIIKQGTLRACGPTADVVGDESLEDVFLQLTAQAGDEEAQEILEEQEEDALCPEDLEFVQDAVEGTVQPDGEIGQEDDASAQAEQEEADEK